MGQIIAGGEQFETHIEADHRGRILQKGPDSGAVDAFGRLRTASPLTLFDSTLRFDKRPDQWYEKITGGASVNYLPNQSSLELKTTTASGDVLLRRTKQNFPYQPGKSLLVYQSFVANAPIAGLKQEVGFFNDQNGIMFRASGTTLQMVVRGYANGIVEEQIIPQSQWNIDTFDDLDVTKINIFTADLEWLGGGRVRTGFVVDGEYKYCHEFNHANAISSVYMTSAILPLSYRIENLTAQASGRTLKQVCCSVNSEGGYEPDGPIYSITHPLATVANTTGERIVAGIRMASGRTDNVILPVKVDVACTTNDLMHWRLRLNPSLSGVVWSDADNGRGNVQVTTSGVATGGTIVNAGLASQGGSTALEIPDAIRLALGQNASGVSDTLILTVDSDVASKATGLLGWVEVV